MELWGMKIVEKTVYINCSGFFKILDVKQHLENNNEQQQNEPQNKEEIELLDGTRIHPENYGVARKICKDALDDNDTEGDNIDLCVEKVMRMPSLLKDI